MTRILITGFGPFPGQPTNPTMRLARHAGRTSRLRFAGVERLVRLLPTTWAMLDGVPAMLSETKPDAVLMFGVAGRRRKVTPELRAMNHQSALKPDADGRFAGARSRVAGAPFARKAALDARRLQVVIQRAGASCGLSQNAGGYLCNALSWHVLASGIPAIFVHVPRPRRMQRRKGHEKRSRPTMRQLERAAAASLGFVVAAMRR
jgi:pyroglutamyl-peptidase